MNGYGYLVEAVILLVRATLAAILIASGAAKLADIPGFAKTLTALGMPIHLKHWIRGLALAIPLFECSLGIASISGVWHAGIDLVVLLLMASFSVVVALALRWAPQTTCRCFGALSDSQFSTKGLMRNLLLTLLAGVVVWSGNVTTWEADDVPSAVVVVLVIGYATFGVAVAQAAKTVAQVKGGAAA